MRKVVAALFITLDGVVEAPGPGDTTLPEHRGWSQPFMNADIGMTIMDAFNKSDAMLVGRKTYEGFAAFWPAVPEDDPFGNLMNNRTKYVVSTTLDKAEWKNSTLIKGDLTEEINKLKQQPGLNIAMTGSGTLVNSMLECNLIDELQLLVCPVVLGVGKRLFDSGLNKTMKLLEVKPFDTGMVMLSYGKAD